MPEQSFDVPPARDLLPREDDAAEAHQGDQCRLDCRATPQRPQRLV
jgi:hypothetical protein